MYSNVPKRISPKFVSVPLSLQDHCKLQVISCIDSYPMYWLCKLPLSIRKKLLKVLPIFDCLHLENTAFCDGLEENTAYCQGQYLKGSNDDIKKLIVKSLFQWKRSYMLIQGCQLNLANLFIFLDCLSSPTDLVNYMGVMSSNFVLLSEYIYSDHPQALIPKRFMKLFTIESYPALFEITINNLKDFINYCNAQTTTVGSKFTIYIFCLIQSHIWDHYKKIQEEAMIGNRDSEKIIIPACPQFIQAMFSSVEVVDVVDGGVLDSMSCSLEFPIEGHDLTPNIALYFILHIFMPFKIPVLKSLDLHDIPNMFEFYNELSRLDGKQYKFHFQSEDNEFCLFSSPLRGIKRISSNGCDMTSYDQYMTSHESNVFACSVIENQNTSRSTQYTKQVKNLKLIKISEEHLSLLERLLIQLVQSPQFCRLLLGEAPDFYCHDLIIAFLSIPTSHDQELSISLRKRLPFGFLENTPVPEDLPETNLQFKSLYLGDHFSHLAQYIVRFPYLNLKHLSISASNLFAAISKMNISSVQLYMYIRCKQPISVTILADKLDLFVGQNPSLTKLTFSFSNYHSCIYKRTQECFSLFPSINICLRNLLGTNHKLSEIELNRVYLFSFSIRPNWDFINIPFQILYNDLHDFFVLVQRLGVTLTLSECILNEKVIVDLIPALEKAFAGSTKIKEIVLKYHLRGNETKEIFEKVARTVVIA